MLVYVITFASPDIQSEDGFDLDSTLHLSSRSVFGTFAGAAMDCYTDAVQTLVEFEEDENEKSELDMPKWDETTTIEGVKQWRWAVPEIDAVYQISEREVLL